MSNVTSSTPSMTARSDVGLRAPSLLAALRAHAAERPDVCAYTFLTDGDDREESLTYGALDLRARRIAARLQDVGASGGRALLVYPSGLELIAAFFGCVYARIVAVPVYPPDVAHVDRSLRWIDRIVADAQPSVVLTTALMESYATAGMRGSRVAGLPWLATDAPATGWEDEWHAPELARDGTAFLQYTSGSTGTPRGVMVTHANIVAQARCLADVVPITPHTTVVGWVPLYHDMGLVGVVLSAMHTGQRSILMSPAAFLARPLRWLAAISRFRGEVSPAPNFAYELCVRKIDAADRTHLDLSTWRAAVNGAEPVRPSTLERFAATFRDCGFRREAFQPCYGLAEGTLMVSGGVTRAHGGARWVDGASLERHRVVEVEPNAPRARALAGCGPIVRDTRVLIVDPETRVACGPDDVGEIWITGPCVAAGYWNDVDATAHAFAAYVTGRDDGPFLRTGDLGFIREDELFVTGRRKDLLIVRGRNHYPQDIEHTLERAHPALRLGCGAAFSVEQAGEERLVVVHEVRSVDGEGPPPASEDVIDAIRRAITAEHGIAPWAIVLVRARTIPKTSSGKIRRQACRASFLEGGLDVVAMDTAAATVPVAHVANCPALPGAVDARQTTAPDLGARRAALTDFLAAEIAKAIGREGHSVDAGRRLSECGADSLAIVELRESIETTFAITLPPAVLLDDVPIDRLAETLERLIDAQRSAAMV